MDIGSRIKKIREFNKLNQRDFASSIKIGQSTLAMFENGQRKPKAIHIEQICSKYNVNEEWLRSGIGEPYISKTGKFSELISNLEDSDDDFIKDLLIAYMNLDNNSKKALQKLAKEMTEKRKKQD